MLAAAVLAMVLILLAITFAPRIYAYFFARREHYVRVRRPEPDVRDLVFDALGQEPDAAEDVNDGVVIYSGGASSPAVVLQKRVMSIPLSVANVDDTTVRFHSSGGFEVVASGAMAHVEFGLAPLSGAELVMAKARDPLVYVAPRKTGALVEQKYDGYYNDNISFFDTAKPMGQPTLTASIVKGDEGSRYSYRWTGVIRPRKSGPHEFWTRSDDASHVFIDGIKVIDNSGVHPPQDRAGSIDLSADRQYSFEVYFGENEGGAEMTLRWHGPDQGWQTDLTPLLEMEAAPLAARHVTRLRSQQGPQTGNGALDQGVVRFAHFGPESQAALISRKDIADRPSTCYGIQLDDARKTIAAHDMSAYGSPTVSEVMKAANLQAVSMYFTAKGEDRSVVSVFVLPRRAGLPPVSVHVDFVGNDLRLTYLLQTDSVDAGPSTVAQNATAQADRDTVTLPGARTGSNDVMVFVEIVRGKVRVATVEPNRERGYILQAPTFLRDDEPLRTDALDPPAVMVSSKNVDELVVVPFCVGDLRSMIR